MDGSEPKLIFPFLERAAGGAVSLRVSPFTKDKWRNVLFFLPPVGF